MEFPDGKQLKVSLRSCDKIVFLMGRAPGVRARQALGSTDHTESVQVAESDSGRPAVCRGLVVTCLAKSSSASASRRGSKWRMTYSIPASSRAGMRRRISSGVHDTAPVSVGCSLTESGRELSDALFAMRTRGRKWMLPRMAVAHVSG